MGVADSSILFLYPGLCLLAVCFASFVSWIFREVKGRVPSELNVFEQAFLIGGPVRTIEVALFQLIRDGWVYTDGRGFFYPRFERATALSPIEHELLNHAVNSKKIDGRLLGQLDLPSLQPIEERLLRRGLILTEKEFSLGRTLTRLPIFAVFAFGFRWIYVHGMHADPSPWLLGISAVTFFIFIQTERGRGRLSHVGTRLVSDLRAARDARVSEKTAHERVSDDRASYDRLWEIKDEVLFMGIAKMQGTAFSNAGTQSESGVHEGVGGNLHTTESVAPYPTQDEATTSAQTEERTLVIGGVPNGLRSKDDVAEDYVHDFTEDSAQDDAFRSGLRPESASSPGALTTDESASQNSTGSGSFTLTSHDASDEADATQLIPSQSTAGSRDVTVIDVEGDAELDGELDGDAPQVTPTNGETSTDDEGATCIIKKREGHSSS